MYNEERKRKFINDCTLINSMLESMFKTTEPYEKEFGCDLSEFTTEMMQKLFDENFGEKVLSIKTRQGIIRNYYEWSRVNGYKTLETVDNITLNASDKVKQSMVGSPKQLDRILNRTLTPTYAHTVDCLCRCYVWCAYIGIPEHKVESIRRQDVDLVNKTIILDDNIYEIVDEALPVFDLVLNLESFMYHHPDYHQPVKRKRLDGELLFRGVRTNAVTLNSLKVFVRDKINKRSSFKIKYKQIMYSGLFYRFYRLEQHKIELDFNVLTESFYQMFNSNSDVGAEMVRIRKHALQHDYSNWKKAFYPSRA